MIVTVEELIKALEKIEVDKNGYIENLYDDGFSLINSKSVKTLLEELKTVKNKKIAYTIENFGSTWYCIDTDYYPNEKTFSIMLSEIKAQTFFDEFRKLDTLLSDAEAGGRSPIQEK